MNIYEQNVICSGCPKQKTKIKNSGCKYDVDYVVFDVKSKRYLIVELDDILKIANLGLHEFTFKYVPKFGKYEIEEYVGFEILKALFITKDLTDLLNSELACATYNPLGQIKNLKIKNEDLKEKVLKMFDIVEESEEQVHLKFKLRNTNTI